MTAALLCALPSLWARLTTGDGERMAERLRPKKAQIFTVWILSDATESRTQLNQQIALFEKQNPGVHVYLRRADSAELFAENAVLPDVVLFSPGALTDPGRVLLPIVDLPKAANITEDILVAGKSRGLQYGVPLWVAPSVLTVPTGFFPVQAVPAPAPTQTSFFDLSTPMPTSDLRKRSGTPEAPKTGGTGDTPALPDDSLIPWLKLMEPGSMTAPKGIALVQLLSMCPLDMRPALIASLAEQALAPKQSPQPQQKAEVMTLAAYQNAIASGKPLIGFAMKPACTEKVLLLGVCNDHQLSRAFLAGLLCEDAQSALVGHALLPVIRVSPAGDAMTLFLTGLYQNGLLFPNAFEHTAQELDALCLDAFRQSRDPVETLLRLR